MDNSYLLSICIPTYNGASSLLKEVLDNATPLLEEFKGEVELIVSDNCSIDSTSDLLKKYSSVPGFRSYRNEKNLGFNKNMLLLVETYSKGFYSWVIGDDDIIIPSAFRFIINELRKGKYDYLSLGSNIIPASELNAIIENKTVYKSVPCSYAKAIDYNCYDGNVLSSFIGGSIFNTQRFREFPKSFIKNSFDEFRNVFPNGYILASVFYNSSSLCVPQTSIVSIEKEKAWSTSDNIYLIYTQYLPNLYKHLLSKGCRRKDLKITYRTLLYKATMVTIVRLKKREEVKGCIRIFIRVLSCPPVLIRIISNFFKKLYLKPINY